MGVRKAVFPAAGKGTRFLPITKAIPKEMLPLVDKPLIQYGVEEAIRSGLSEVIIVTGRGKTAIEDHFDFSQDFEELLKRNRKIKALREVKILNKIHFSYTRQSQPLGLGHAVLCARNLIGDEPFAVILGDEVIVSDTPALAQLLKVHGRYGGSVLALKRVRKEDISSYGCVVVEQAGRLEGLKAGKPSASQPSSIPALSVYRVLDLVEKPTPHEAPSDLAIVGRYVLSPSVFALLENTPPGKNGEIQLTDALKLLLDKEPVYAVEIEGERFDAGSMTGFIKANLAFALRRPELRRELKEFLEQLED